MKNENNVIFWHGRVTVEGRPSNFITRDKFDTGSQEVRFYLIGETFRSLFLNGAGKVEKPSLEQVLRYGSVTMNSPASLFSEFADKPETVTLADLWALLKRQPKGGEGKILTNGRQTFFSIRDEENGDCLVWAYFTEAGWIIDASIAEERLKPFIAGCRFFTLQNVA